MELLRKLFSADGFMPHGHCYLWDTGVLWLHITSDALIALAYYSIPFTLVYFVRKRRDLAFDWMFLCFAVFIVACGTTHVMEIWSIWHPTYWLSGAVKALTALVSMPTAILLVQLVPKALALPNPQDLKRANDVLAKEVSERKHALEQIQVLNEKLKRKSALLEAANQELEAFSYSVSHDLRAPLRHIGGFAALLDGQAGALDEQGRRHLKAISESTKRMGTLIDDLLVFSRIGRAELRNTTVDLEQLVQETIRGLEQETQQRRIDWKQNPLARVTGDTAMLRQVLINLLANAVKYTRPRDPALIEIGCASETEKEVVVFVRDNGVGFDMKYVNKLFGVFQRLHGNDEFEGTGIGLANVRRTITRHGGRVWAEGKVNEGATFYFSLPKAATTTT